MEENHFTYWGTICSHVCRIYSISNWINFSSSVNPMDRKGGFLGSIVSSSSLPSASARRSWSNAGRIFDPPAPVHHVQCQGLKLGPDPGCPFVDIRIDLSRQGIGKQGQSQDTAYNSCDTFAVHESFFLIGIT
jgi:hypothetical protein